MPTGDRLTFNATHHEYHLDGDPVTSVTQAIEAAHLVDTRWFKDEHAARGTAVHNKIYCVLARLVDRFAADDPHIGYLQAAHQFMEDSQLQPIELEMPVYDEIFRTAGTLDVIGSIPGGTVLVDWKTGAPAPWHGIQLAGYARMARDVHTIDVRMTVHLKKNGTYSTMTSWKDTPFMFDVWDKTWIAVAQLNRARKELL